MGYSVVTFSDGVSIVLNEWLSEDKKSSRWPQHLKSDNQLLKALKEKVLPDGSWTTYSVLEYICECDDLEQANKKAVEARVFSDVQSEVETSSRRRIRKTAGKRRITSSDESDVDDVQPILSSKTQPTSNSQTGSLPESPTVPASILEKSLQGSTSVNSTISRFFAVQSPRNVSSISLLSKSNAHLKQSSSHLSTRKHLSKSPAANGSTSCTSQARLSRSPSFESMQRHHSRSPLRRRSRQQSHTRNKSPLTSAQIHTSEQETRFSSTERSSPRHLHGSRSSLRQPHRSTSLSRRSPQSPSRHLHRSRSLSRRSHRSSSRQSRRSSSRHSRRSSSRHSRRSSSRHSRRSSSMRSRRSSSRHSNRSSRHSHQSSLRHSSTLEHTSALKPMKSKPTVSCLSKTIPSVSQPGGNKRACTPPEVKDEVLFRKKMVRWALDIKVAVESLVQARGTDVILEDDATDIATLLPLDNLDSFNDFEQRLKNNEFKKRVIVYLARFAGRSIEDSISRLCHKCLTDEVAVSYSYYGKGKDRKPFCSTSLHNAIFSAVRANKSTSSTTEGDIKFSVSKFLNRAKERLTAKQLTAEKKRKGGE